jgi:hypothetical protein
VSDFIGANGLRYGQWRMKTKSESTAAKPRERCKKSRNIETAIAYTACWGTFYFLFNYS